MLGDYFPVESFRERRRRALKPHSLFPIFEKRYDVIREAPRVISKMMSGRSERQTSAPIVFETTALPAAKPRRSLAACPTVLSGTTKTAALQMVPTEGTVPVTSLCWKPASNARMRIPADDPESRPALPKERLAMSRQKKSTP